MNRIKTLLVCLLMVLAIPQPISACNYSAMMRSYNRAVEKWRADPTPARAERICRIIARIQNKFTNTPPNPTPPPPPGVACTALLDLGNGRGGGPGGVIIGAGFSATSAGWVRNPTDETCEYAWEVIPDPLNPLGFTVFPTSGTVIVPPFGTVPAPFDLIIDPFVVHGTSAGFDIFWTDMCLGLPLPPDSSHFQVTADSELTVLPMLPFFIADAGIPLDVLFEVTNHTDAPVARTFDFQHIGDPGSIMEFNNGLPFDAINLFPTDKSVSSVDVLVDPFSTIPILKETLLKGEICDPAMINCCGLASGDAVCCAMIFNSMEDPHVVTPLFQDLLGAPLGGNIGLQIEGFPPIQIPTQISPEIPGLLDALTLQLINASLQIDQFNFGPLLDDTGLMLMAPLDIPVQFFSTDPGLQWGTGPPLLLPLCPQWASQPELMLQSMIPLVNGQLPLPDAPRRGQSKP